MSLVIEREQLDIVETGRPIVWSPERVDLRGIEVAFRNNDGVARCMDERTPGGIHAAGSGLLISDGAGKFDDDIAEQVAFLKAAGAKEITRHRGCGAEAAWAKELGLTDQEAEEKLAKRARNVAEKLNVPYSMIEFDKMAPFGPKDGHRTGVIYYDATGKFDYSKVKELPAGFIISRGLHPSAEYSLFETEFAVGIIFGHHGLGEKWFKENNEKLSIVVIGNEKLSTDFLIQELLGTVDLNPELIVLEKFPAF